MLNKKIIFGIFILVLLVTGFVIWSKFFCSACQATEGNLANQILNLSSQTSLSSSQTASPAPYFVLKDLNDKTVSLADFKGKNVLLVFWATYCGWCAKEKEDLKRFTDEQKGKIEVIAIDDESRQALLDYVSKENINFMILLDEGRATFEKYQVLGTPAHFLINTQGESVARRPGYTSYADLLILTQALEER